MPGAEDLPNLPYTGMILAESLRLFPPTWISPSSGLCSMRTHCRAAPQFLEQGLKKSISVSCMSCIAILDTFRILSGSIQNGLRKQPRRGAHSLPTFHLAEERASVSASTLPRWKASWFWPPLRSGFDCLWFQDRRSSLSRR